MNKFILTAILMGIISSTSFAQTKHKRNNVQTIEIDIPFQVAKGYFVNNSFKKDSLPNAKITTQEEFDELFGRATVMGKNGKPTPINFEKQFVIAVIGRVTDLYVKMTPISLKKKANKILFKYSTLTGKKQSSFMQPLTMIVVDKNYTEQVETFNLQIKDENR
jgi:hypothetical protein